MYWKMKEFDIAYEKAELVLKEMNYDTNEMIPTSAIMDTVEKILGIDVKFTDYDFKKFNKKDKSSVKFEKFGAAMCVEKKDDEITATILLNERETPAMKRFSLVHELGHLITQDKLVVDENCGYQVSTHINMDITSIPNKIVKKHSVLIDEQIANIFALLVLIPMDMLLSALKEHDSLEGVARFFGVEKNALISRILLKDFKRNMVDAE